MKTKIKNKTLMLFFAVMTAIGFSFPNFSEAAIVSCGTKSSPTACTLCDFIVGIHALIAWGRNVSIYLAILTITVAGIMYIVSSGNSSTVEKAKSAIKNVVIGMVVLLTAWVIINYGLFLLGASNNIGMTVGSGTLKDKWWTAQLTCESITSHASYTEGAGVIASATEAAIAAIPSTGACGTAGPPASAGKCYDQAAKDAAIAAGSFTAADFDKYYSKIDTDLGSGCGFGGGDCLSPRPVEGNGCRAFQWEADPDTGVNSEVFNTGICTAECGAPAPGTVIEPSNDKYSTCRDGLKCCKGGTATSTTGGACTGTNAACCKAGTQCLDCTNCVDFSNTYANLCYKGAPGNTGCKLHSSLASKLTPAVLSPLAEVSEAWPPTVFHSSTCHRIGTCADVRCKIGCASESVANIKIIYNKIKSAGLSPVFEAPNCGPYTAVGIKCITPSTMTGASFHVNM